MVIMEKEISMLTSMLCAVALGIAADAGPVETAPPQDYLAWGPTPARSLTTGNPAADLNGDGIIDIHDVLLFLNCWQNNLPCADFNGDGVIDFADVLGFINA